MKNKTTAKIAALILAAAFMLSMLAGCSGGSGSGTSNYVNPDVTADVTYTFTDSGVTADAGGDDSIKGTGVIISSPGTYAFTGECSDGCIIVSKDAGDVTLILNGLTLTYSEGAPINAGGGTTNVTITLAEGTENMLSDTDRDESKPKAAVNADGSLTINGTGALTVNGSNKNGIKTDDDLTIEDASLTVISADDGICAEGTLTIGSGSFNITSGGSAISVSGTLTINGGTFDIDAGADAVHGDTDVFVTRGEFTVTAADDAFHADSALTIGTEGGSDDDLCITVKSSLEGFEGETVCVYSGNIDITASDDGINAAGGTSARSAGSGGTDAEMLTADSVSFEQGARPGRGDADGGMPEGSPGEPPEGFTGEMSEGFPGEPPEGFDGERPEGFPGEPPEGFSGERPEGFPGEPSEGFSGERPEGSLGEPPEGFTGEMSEGFPGEPPEGFSGEMPDGAGGQPPEGFGGESPNGAGAAESGGAGYAVYIYGGNITIKSGGDGIDSNGNIYVLGGTTLVYASEDGSNGAIDYGDVNSSLTMTGGTLLAVGNSRMAQGPGSDSSVKSVIFTLSSEVGSGDEVSISDADGNTVFTFDAVKRANHVVFASEDLSGGTYTLSVNGSAVSTCEAK
ncbi:MAG: carbohydrate-binding domain-containing protein [Clostridia bacterium]|nr:carbohydrate-binding domain-containing protein [Clostridia bacterium]